MSDRIIPGAYIIRNKKTATVLHTDKLYFKGSSSVLAYKHEVKFANQQIWWIEPLPNYEDNEGPVYSITTPASGRSLDVNPGEGTAYISVSGECRLIGWDLDPDKAYCLCAFKHHGEAWQRWRIKNCINDEGVQVISANIYMWWGGG